MSGERYEQVGCTLVHDGQRYWSILPRIVEPGGEVWQPVYVKVPVDPVAPTVQELERCPTCGSDNPSIYVTGTPQNPDRERCPDPWHAVLDKGGHDG